MKLQKLKEEFPLEGILSIYRSKDGILKELIYKESNLITLATRQLFLSYVYQYPGITSDPVTGLKVGTGGTIDPQGLFPKQEDPSWTALEHYNYNYRYRRSVNRLKRGGQHGSTGYISV
jgi:hypothetical protein